MKKVVIVGPGGLGGLVAAQLARRVEACEVTVITRPGAHAEAIRRDGLRLEGLDEFTVPLEVVDDPRHVEQCDVLILAVKSQHAAAALEQVGHIQVNDFVTSLQNGTIKDDVLGDAFGRDKTIGGVAILAGERPQPGVINWTYDGGTQFGEFDGTRSERVDWIVDLFNQSGLTAEATQSILSATWSKMVGWIPIGLFATLARRDNAQVLSDPLLAREYTNIVRELSALAHSHGITLQTIGPYHVGAWTQGSVPEAVEMVMASPLAGSHSRHSAFQDVAKGLTTEFSASIGPLLEDARIRAVPLPKTEALYAALIGLEASLKEEADAKAQ
jgi:2-dehydropantoate 2-reductase